MDSYEAASDEIGEFLFDFCHLQFAVARVFVVVFLLFSLLIDSFHCVDCCLLHEETKWNVFSSLLCFCVICSCFEHWCVTIFLLFPASSVMATAQKQVSGTKK